jgi:hypothetical protein
MNKKPCIFFQKGSCRNGNTCKFLHVKDGSGPSGNFSGPRRPGGNPNPNHQPAPRHHNNHSGPRHNNNHSGPRHGNQHSGPRHGNNHSGPRHGNRPDPRSNKKTHNQNQPNTPNVQDTLTNTDMKDLNLKRKNGGLRNLFFSSVTQVENILLLVVKDVQYIVLFNLETNQFLPNPLYINCDINQKILSIKSGKFGNIDGNFVFVNYLHFNELSLEYSSKILITPLSTLDSHRNFLTLNISNQAEINEFYIDQQVLLTAVYDNKSNQSEIKLTMIHDIAKQSADLKQLSKSIESSLNAQIIEGKVSNISRVGNNLLLALSTGRLFVLDISTSSTQYIEGINGEAILMHLASFAGSTGNEMILVTNSGDLKLAAMGNPLQSRLTNQMNTPLFKAKYFQFNQGRCN